MARSSPAYFAACLCFGWLAAGGCGTSAKSHKPNDLPAWLMADGAASTAEAAGPTGKVGTLEYRPGDSVESRPRILQLSAESEVAGRELIRQPSGVTEASSIPPETAPRRSAFVPIAMPPGNPPPPPAQVPQLASRASFPPIQQSLPATTTQATAPSGPMLNSPQQVEATDARRTVNSVTASPRIPSGPSPQSIDALRPAAQRAMQMADHATAIAQRGMLYSARSELTQALQLLAQALDVQEGSTRHATALSTGLTALEEARDFTTAAARPGEAINAGAVATGHRTAIFQGREEALISPVVAQQQYFALAQEQLATAAGGIPAASEILYRLGRLQTGLAAHDSDPLALHGPRAIVFHQAALMSDGGNYLAANELGVLMARYGQLAESRRLLVHSVTVRPHVEGWHNLSVVHQRLGETDLAERADRERQLLAQQINKPTAAASNEMVRWVEPKAFAASGTTDAKWPENTPPMTASSPTTTQRR